MVENNAQQESRLPDNVIIFPNSEEREKIALPVHRLTCPLPSEMTFEEARGFFEHTMDPLRSDMSAVERFRALEREYSYIHAGFTIVEGRGLLGIWKIGANPQIDQRAWSKVDQKAEQAHHLVGNSNYFISSFICREKGMVELHESLYRFR